MSLLVHRYDRSIIFASRLLSGTLICGLLHWAKMVLIPLAFSILIAFMLYPLVRWLRKFRIPNAAAVVLVAACSAVALSGLTWAIGTQVAGFSAELPQFQENITLKISSIRSAMRGGTIEKLQDTIATVSEDVAKIEEAEEKEKEKTEPRAPRKPESDDPIAVYISSPPRMVNFDALASFGPLIEPLTSLGLVLLLSVLMLLKWSELRARMLAFVEPNLAGTTNTTHAVEDAGHRIRTYLGTQLLYNSVFGVVAGVGLAALGVPYAPLWGLCAAVLRYIPYAGPVVAAAFPLVVSLVTSEGWSQVAGVAILFLVLELVSNNFVEPWLYGSRVGLSEIGIIIAAVAWTFLWGPSGLVLATPLTVCLVVLGENVRALSFIARLLGAKPTISSHFHLYQRLLAEDKLDASDLANRALDGAGKEASVENVFLPALSLARHEWMAGRLEADQAQKIARILPEIYQAAVPRVAAEEPDPPEPDALPEPVAPPVVFWASCPISDAALPLITSVLDGLRMVPESINARQLAGAVVERLAAEPPSAICLVHLDRQDFARVRARALRVRGTLPDIPVIIARLGGFTFDADERAALAKAGATVLVTSLSTLRACLAPRILDFPAPSPT